MVFLHSTFRICHQLNGHEFEYSPGVGDGQEAWKVAVHGIAKSQT